MNDGFDAGRRTPKLMYREMYGTITLMESRAISRNHVTPHQHRTLCALFGRQNHKLITEFITATSAGGMYCEPAWVQDALRDTENVA